MSTGKYLDVYDSGHISLVYIDLEDIVSLPEIIKRLEVPLLNGHSEQCTPLYHGQFEEYQLCNLSKTTQSEMTDSRSL